MPVFHLRQLRFPFKVFQPLSCPLVCFGHLYVSSDTFHLTDSKDGAGNHFGASSFLPTVVLPAIPLLGIRTILTCFRLLTGRQRKSCEWWRLRCSRLPASVYYFIPPPVTACVNSRWLLKVCCLSRRNHQQGPTCDQNV